MGRTITLAACMAVLMTGAADAKSKAAESPLVQALAACKAQPNDTARLRCYDAAAAALTEATARGDVVVLDQAEVRTARHSLFGFNVPKLPFFGGDRSGGEQSDELTAKIASARPIAGGKWQIKLEDGALWETTEASMTLDDPRPGNTLVIKRGPLGSYMMRIAGQRGLRSKRVG